MRKFGWLLGACLLVGCASQEVVLQDVLVVGEETRSTASFQGVSVKGPFNVTLHTGAAHPHVSLRARAEALPFIKTQVVDGMLSIRCPKDFEKYGSMSADIYTHALRSFRYRGKGEIIGNHLQAPVLNVSIDNPRSSHFSGHLGLKRVTISGGGRATFQGVDASELALIVNDRSKVQMSGRVRLAGLRLKRGSSLNLSGLSADRLTLREYGDTHIHLVGKVNMLDVELWDRATFRGRHLIANDTFIKTHGASMAEIYTLFYQHTLATDSSNIYFYHLPKVKADLMARNGSVLNRVRWTPAISYDPNEPDD